MKTLQIATTNNAPFFNKQVEYLERQGVDCDVLAVSPGRYEYEEFVADLPSPLRALMPEVGYTARYGAANAALSYPRLLAKIRSNDYDLIHSNGGLCAPFAAFQPVRPVVQTFWGSDLMGSYALGQYDKVCKAAARHFSASIVRNDAMRAELQPHADASVIPSGVDMDLFQPADQSEARDELHWDRDMNYILFPYRPFIMRKNPSLAIESVHRAREKSGEPITLEFVHDEPFERMPTYYNAADALILPSDLEGSPNTVKEAMACNTPVVATDVGDVSHLLDGVAESTVASGPEPVAEQLADGILTAIEADGKADSRESVEHLGWEPTAQRIVDIYTDVLQ